VQVPDGQASVVHGLLSSHVATAPVPLPQVAHVPVVHTPLAHCVAAVHAVPTVFFVVHTPPVQYVFVAQLLDTVHAVQTGGLPVQ
jgi:hypothetical protein